MDNKDEEFTDKISSKMAETKIIFEKIKKMERGEIVNDNKDMPKFFKDLLKGKPFGGDK